MSVDCIREFYKKSTKGNWLHKRVLYKVNQGELTQKFIKKKKEKKKRKKKAQLRQTALKMIRILLASRGSDVLSPLILSIWY